ncbi:MAG: ABC transporter substrate-binding protein, partial [Deltaproteobacteria bacterium]|nr:ABC transporter substrate-binding protein [Deltaproteobacteria bacterium]
MKKFILVAVVFAFAGCFVLSGATPTIAAEKPKYGGTLNFIHGKSAGVIGDPLGIRGWNHEFVDFVLNTLVTPKNKELGKFEGTLATSWKLAPDKKSIVFKLRKGVKFHDGTDFNAQAAKWNLDRWVKAKRPRMRMVTSIDAIDDYTLKCNVSSWDAVSLFDFAKDTFIISPTAFEKNGKDWAKYNPVGTGAFKVVALKRNVHVTYKKNPDYWEKGLPYLDGIKCTTIANPTTAIASLKQGENDAWLGVDNVSAAELKASGEFKLFTKLFTNPGPKAVFQFNSEDPKSPWSKKEMREALEYAVDKKAITKAVGRGFTYPVYDIIHSIPKGAKTTPRRYDPEKAKQLMKKAGYPNGVKVKVKHSANPNANDSVVALQAFLKAVGIEIVPEPITGAAFHELLFKPVTGHDLLMGNQRGGPNELLVSVAETLGKGSVFFQGIKKPKGFYELIDKG